SPDLNADGTINLLVKINGTALPDTTQVLRIRVDTAINRIPRAEISLIDGDMAAQEFSSSDSALFNPGGKIEISAGYDQKLQTIFSGLILGQRLEIRENNLCLLTLDCRDPAIAMTAGRKNANFVDKKDSDIASKLIGAYAGLSAAVSATTTQWKEIVQYYCSDWDFLLSRAEANGFVVFVDGGKVNFAAPKAAATPCLTVTYGQDLRSFDANLEARDQYSKVTATAWDIKNQAIVQGSATPQGLAACGNLSAKTLADVLKLSDYKLQTCTALDSTALKDWATGQQVKSELSQLRGSASFQGSALPKLGSTLGIAGLPKHFNGTVYISGIEQEIGEGNWWTRVTFGLSPTWHAEARALETPPAAGLVPGVEGLQIGVVKKLSNDPDGQLRIQVSIPLLQAETDGVWARLMQFHATKDQGAFFVPEIGDEVVLGYFNNDPSAPVILGSLYSSGRKMPYAISDENNYKKAITTKSGLKIEYDDEKKVMTLITPAKNQIVISDDGKSILLQDQNSNKVKLFSGGISLDSPKDITLTAQGNIALTATGKVAIKATQDATMQGMNVTHTAQVGFTGKGSATAEVSASGQTTIKGAMVMIN
ncbi:MAG: hypothetical protein RIR00_2013, partial [Pseudomonadota bacterium]